MFALLHSLTRCVIHFFKSPRRLEAENLFLRHQLSIALRRAPRRLQLRGSDRVLLVWPEPARCGAGRSTGAVCPERGAGAALVLSFISMRSQPKRLLHDDHDQPTYAARCWASASAAVLGCVGSVRTVAFCPSQSRVSKTISPSGNSSAS